MDIRNVCVYIGHTISTILPQYRNGYGIKGFTTFSKMKIISKKITTKDYISKERRDIVRSIRKIVL